jgi:Tfp pilus assembly protein PilO
MQIDRPIAIALILFVIILLIFFLVAPEYATFGKLKTELSEKKAEYAAEYDYYAAIAKTYADLQEHKDDVKKIDDALPQDPSLGKTVYYLQQTSKANGLILKNLFLSKSSKSTGEATSGSSVKDIVFSLNLTGDYASLENFIIALEKSSRLFEVTNISFGAASNSATTAQTTQSQSKTQTPAPAPAQAAYSFTLQVKTHTY